MLNQYFHGDLEEHIYMEHPDWFTQPGHDHMIGYKQCEYDCCVYVKSHDDGSFIFLLLYVDDMLIAAKNMHDVLALKALLSQEFDMKDLSAATKILEMEIHRDGGSRKLSLSQQGYVEKVLDRFGMSKAKPVSTQLANHFKLSSEQYPKTDREIEDMEKVPYASAVGCLIHHWEAIKWIFKYMKGTVGQWKLLLVDTDYALDGRNGNWNIVQSIVALSTTEAEYMKIAGAAKEAL
ncbi:UNVERIFIED_CONTAM: Retrovirus-related Pol polyprotein from transposon TNT 1-94 [Sesamum latifolium]|uniref:Retrovirus-related Pol polyprotein from transposon TNT 1-94 n=1 Tax=Sesamum latifolium TaxID=2727402 RepID=A0AAW2WBJ3_9LAMI